MPAETQIIISSKDLASDTFVQVGRGVDSLKHKLELAERYIPFLGVAGAAYLSGEALKGMLEHTVESMDKMGKLAEQTGMTVEEITAFSYVAKMADVDLEFFAKSVERLEKNMVGAAGGVSEGMDSMATGGNKVRAALLSMGYSQKDIVDGLKDIPGFLSSIAGKFESYENGATKTALAMNLFGKSGAGMVSVLNKGSEGFKELFDEAKNAGNVLSGETARQAEEVVDAFKRLHGRIDGAKTLIVTGLLPTMKDLTDTFFGAKGEAADYSNTIVTLDYALRGAANTALFMKAAIITSAQGYLMLKDAYKDGPNLKGEIEHHQQIIEKEWLDYGKNAKRLIEGVPHPKATEHGKGDKPQAPRPDTDNGKGADTLKTLMQDAMKAEESLHHLQGTYEEIILTMQGDTFGATLAREMRDSNKQQDEALREFRKIADERKSLSAKGKLTPQAKEILDRQETAVVDRLVLLPKALEWKLAGGVIKNSLEQLAQEAAHDTAMSGFTGQGVYEAQVKAIQIKYDALRKDPKTMGKNGANIPMWDAEQQAALARAGQDHAKALASQRAELAQLTGNTREYYLAQADVLAIDYQLAQTDADRALKAEQYARVMAQANGDWINASKTALSDYARDAGDTWKQVHDTVGSVATDMENYMVDSAMGTKNAWANACTSIERDFIRMLTRLGPMKSAMNMAGDFISGGLEDLFGYTPLASEGYSQAQTDAAVNALASKWESVDVPAFASGGSTPNGPILTGENGPEIWNPGGPGFVYTADQTASMLGGGSSVTNHHVTINQSFDFSGADTGTETRLRAMMGAMKQQTKAEVLAEWQALNNRGGAFAKNSGRRQ